jgi:NDP-hexose 4-ketoreductase
VRAVVLGGGGFVGAPVTDALVEAGADVLVVSRGAARRPGARSAAMDLETGDLTGLLAAQRPQLVVNAVGEPWCPDPARLARLNVTVVERVIKALPARARLVQIGTIHEYGVPPPGRPITEATPPAPTTPYGRTKAAATRAVLDAARAGRIDAVVLRVANVLGPRPVAGSLLGLVLEQLCAGESVRVARLDGARDYVDVRDVAAAVLAAATAPPGAGVVNIGRGELVPLRQLVRRLIEVSGRPAALEENTAAGAPPSAGARMQPLDISRARHRLGWAPRHDLTDSLRLIWPESARVEP